MPTDDEALPSLSCPLDARLYRALLTGAVKITVKEMTASAVVDGLLAASGEASPARAQVVAHLDAVLTVLGTAARDNLSAADVRVLLDGSDISAEHKDLFVEVWKGQRAAVHDAMVDAAAWTPTLKQTAYRVDVLTSSKTSRDLSEPTAILELRTGTRRADATASADASTAPAAAASTVRFEVGRTQLQGLLESLDAIDGCIAEQST